MRYHNLQSAIAPALAQVHMYPIRNHCRCQLGPRDTPRHGSQREALQQHRQNDLRFHQRQVAADALALAGTKRNPGLLVPIRRRIAQEARGVAVVCSELIAMIVSLLKACGGNASLRIPIVQ